MEDITTETQIIIINYLHEDALCRIFSHLDDIDLKSASLVCKLFYSLSSPLVHGLNLKHSSLTHLHFERLFQRFSGAKKICIHKFYYLDSVLSAICNSDLNLEKLRLVVRYSTNALYPMHQTIEKMSISRVINGIKSLELKMLFDSRPKLRQKITQFVNMLPSLTELDLSGCSLQWDDEEGIDKVTSKLPNLRKINLSDNPLLTDKTLDILSSNCRKLESVNFKKCKQFTAEALYKFFCKNPQLSSVDIPPLNSKMVECMQVLKNLNRLSFYIDHLEDAAFAGLAEPRPLLKSLVMKNYVLRSNYTMTGLSQLLSVCPGLESLHIDLLHLENCNTDDAELSIVVKRLPNLKHITVCSFFICQATLLSLVQNCPLLETISLRRCICLRQIKQVYCEQVGITIATKKNYNIKSIKIRPESDIWLLSSIESYCPNLRKIKTHYMNW